MNSSAYASPAPNWSHYNQSPISISDEDMFFYHDNLVGDVVELTLPYITTAVALMFGYYMTLVLSTRLFGHIIKHLRSSTTANIMIVIATYATYVDLVFASPDNNIFIFFAVLLVIGITFGLAIIVYINKRLQLSIVSVMVAAASTSWAVTSLMQFMNLLGADVSTHIITFFIFFSTMIISIYTFFGATCRYHVLWCCLLEVEELVQQVDEDVAEPPLAAANAVEVEAADDYELWTDWFWWSC